MGVVQIQVQVEGKSVGKGAVQLYMYYVLQGMTACGGTREGTVQGYRLTARATGTQGGACKFADVRVQYSTLQGEIRVGVGGRREHR